MRLRFISSRCHGHSRPVISAKQTLSFRHPQKMLYRKTRQAALHWRRWTVSTYNLSPVPCSLPLSSSFTTLPSPPFPDLYLSLSRDYRSEETGSDGQRPADSARSAVAPWLLFSLGQCCERRSTGAGTPPQDRATKVRDWGRNKENRLGSSSWMRG